MCHKVCINQIQQTGLMNISILFDISQQHFSPDSNIYFFFNYRLLELLLIIAKAQIMINSGTSPLGNSSP